MDTELETIARRIEQARRLEDVFGVLTGQPEEQIKAARLIYHSLSKAIHPDRYTRPDDKQAAHRMMIRLNGFWAEARSKINTGHYHMDLSAVPMTIRMSTRKRDYGVGVLIGSDDVCDRYVCQFEANGAIQLAVFKIARVSDDNDLVAAEAQALGWLRGDRNFERLFPFVPEVYESFLYDDGKNALRQATIVSQVANMYSLEEVHAQYPSGLDPKDVAWMWRKLLIALGFVHARGILHGAAVPPHILIQPAEHGLVLNNWVYAIREPAISGEHLKAIVAAYEAWYPPEVFAKQSPTPSLDIYMAAKCMLYLLGGDPRTNELPTSVPTAIASFFRGCLLPAPTHRPQQAWDVLNEFTQLIERLWGPRTFRPFSMPAR